MRSVLLASLSVALGSYCAFAWQSHFAPSSSAAAHTNYYDAAIRLLEKHPLIDGHVDLPYAVRHLAKSPLDVLDEVGQDLVGHVNLPKLRAGRVAGVFNIAYAPCDTEPTGDDFLLPTNSVEYAMESIDIIYRLIERYPEDFALAKSSSDVRAAFAQGKIASLIGLEGSHHLQNSLAILRLFSQLGVSYMTLTHTCHSSFASSAGDGSPIEPVHEGNGLSDFGRTLIPEMNRLGMMIDLSHVSDETMHDALDLTEAPVIFSHSGARAVFSHPRNVPDDVLRRIGPGPDQNHGVVMAVFYPSFVDSGNATMERVADHIEHIASICGRAHVGLGSDFDGMRDSVEGLEDASKFPSLVAELLSRGWTQDEVIGIIGANMMRVMDDVADVKTKLAGRPAARSVYEKRQDLPVSWAGPNHSYLPEDIQQEVLRRFGTQPGQS